MDQSPPESSPQQADNDKPNLATSILRKRGRNKDDDNEVNLRSKIQRAFLSLDDASLVQAAVYDDDFDPCSRGPLGWGMTAVGAEGRHNTDIQIPQTYAEAVGDPIWGHLWEDAIDKEVTALTSNRTWEVIVPPKGRKLVTSKWVFNVKSNLDGSINKFKARLVARGFSQIWGINFDNTFAPTVRYNTIRLFIAIVCLKY